MMALLGGQIVHAGPAGQWTRITDPNGRNIDEVGLARTANGVLHAVWLRQNAQKQGQQDLLHTAIGANGRVIGSPNAMFTGWAGISNPDLIVTPNGGLRVFFGGLRSTDSNDTNNSLNTATSDASGQKWELLEGKAAASTVAYASPIGATITKEGTPVSSWATTYGLGVHFGIDPTQPDQEYQKDKCCAYDPDVATDAVSGEVVVGWFSNATGDSGLFTQTVAPTVKSKQLVPDSLATYAGRKEILSISQRMAITGRLGTPGIYVAYGVGYPTYKQVNLWRHGSNKPMIVANGQGGARHVNIAAAPDGRLWVMWMRADRLYFTRSNRSVSRFGPVFSIAPPAGTNSVYKLKGEGSLGPLDVFTNVSLGSSSGTAIWHTQIFPRLVLSATPSNFAATRGGKITLQVTDAGDPIAGATISVAGKKLTTNSQGMASLAFSKGKRRSLTANATKTGYSSASTKIIAK